MIGYVLAVDDEPAIRFVYQEFLETRGLSVRVAEDGGAALRSARDERPVLALVDLNLPDMSGLEVIRGLRALYADIPVVVISATPLETCRGQLAQLGVSRFFEKPVDLEELLSVVEQLAA